MSVYLLVSRYWQGIGSFAELTIGRADMEALVGRVVRHELANQQAGPSSNLAETGECLGSI